MDRYVQFLILWLIISLIIGIAGYYYLAKFTFDDSVYGAAMTLSTVGMAAQRIETREGKYFAAAYAIYSGTFFLIIFAIIINRVVSRNNLFY
jgi:hypothetical protein